MIESQMSLMDFVDSLNVQGFDELRKAVLLRHHRQAAEVAKALEYLSSQPALCKAAVSNKPDCAKVLAEKTGMPLGITLKVIDKYLDMKKHFEAQNQDQ